MSTRTLLGMGRLLMRMVLLKPQDNTDESERAIVGNTILLAQPTPKMIAAKLPPTETEQAAYFNVIYGCEASKVSEKKALQVNRAEYLECDSLARPAMPAVRQSRSRRGAGPRPSARRRRPQRHQSRSH